MLKEKDYMDNKRFPLTTQGGLSFSSQQMIDSFNYDEIIRHMQNGEKIDDDIQKRLKELSKKLETNIEEDLKKVSEFNQ